MSYHQSWELQLAIGLFRESEQTSLESLSTPGLASREVIREMMEGKGDLIEERAKCVINAFKVRQLPMKGERNF